MPRPGAGVGLGTPVLTSVPKCPLKGLVGWTCGLGVKSPSAGKLSAGWGVCLGAGVEGTLAFPKHFCCVYVNWLWAGRGGRLMETPWGLYLLHGKIVE